MSVLCLHVFVINNIISLLGIFNKFHNRVRKKLGNWHAGKSVIANNNKTNTQQKTHTPIPAKKRR